MYRLSIVDAKSEHTCHHRRVKACRLDRASKLVDITVAPRTYMSEIGRIQGFKARRAWWCTFHEYEPCLVDIHNHQLNVPTGAFAESMQQHM